ncbi:type VI secretion system protein [Polyangium sorediatum]|uniref:Type VI secretion system protein n=1 Tax=Polyangium sorediatum TaxID=889274 RepID=A0ABT6NX11_9BACT|nr:type VI secretion system protein [Polyangium sorediatum]MDI1432841.1 type VI secretion system protein [Polyangium sorediatum]
MTVGTLLKIVAGLVALAVVVAGAYALFLAQKKKAQKALELAKREGKPDPTAEIRAAVAKAKAALVKKVQDKTAREEMPRYLVLGEPSSGKTTLLGGSGLSVQLIEGGDPAPGDTAAVNLWMLGKALLVDVAGRLLFGEGGTPAPDPPYRALLNELKRLHPDRPVDGILLTVPCGEVMQTARSTPAERKRKATILRAAVSLAQQTLGMNVPVYVIVTQTDRLSGFRSLGIEVTQTGRDDILGWSSPHPPFTEGNEDWVEEALGTVRDALLRYQARRFAGAPVVRSPDDFFLFPSEIESLADGLRTYVDPVFLEGAGQETLTLRGIYFCGLADPPAGPPQLTAPGAAPAAPAPPKPAAAAAPGKVLFAKDLFEHKVFAERNLGKPAVTALRRRQRINLALQVVACCLGGAFLAALWIDASRLERRTTAVMPFLRDVQSNVLSAKSETPGTEASFDAKKLRAKALIEKLETIEESGRLRSPLNPASWWGRLDRRVDTAFVVALEHVLVDTFRAGLTEEATHLLRPLPPQPPPDAFFPLSVEKSQEYIFLETWLRELTAFEAHVARHDGLLGELPKDATPDARMQSVADLSDYLLGYKTSPTIAVDYYRNALARGARRQPFDLAPRRDPAREKATALFKGLQDRVLEAYSDAVVRADVEQLVQSLKDLETKGAEYTAQDLWTLRDAIARVEAHLGAPTLSWVSGESLPPNEGIAGLLKTVKNSRLLGADVEASLRGGVDARLLDLKTYVASAGAPLSGPILERKGGVLLMRLSPFILGLKAPIDALRQQTFMTAEEEKTLTTDLDRSRVDWDAEVLKEAARLPKDYEGFLQGGVLKTVDARIRNTISDLTVRQIKASTLGAVARAARPATPLPGNNNRQFETVRGDAANLGMAMAPIREMIGAFVRLRMDDTRDRLRELMRGQGSEVLGRAADVLRAENLYGLKKGGFTWWDGKSTPAFEAFSVPDAGRLSEYAAAQRTRAATMHKELAEPLLAAMESPEIAGDASGDPNVSLWQNVAWPLKDYENKKAGNGVSNLETLMLSDLPLITAKNCIAELDKRAGVDGAGGFFAGKQKYIVEELRERCRVLASEEMRDRYAALRRTFNRELSGKFPFVKIEPGIRVEDARPETVRRFLQDAADFRSDFGYVLGKDTKASAGEVGRFLEKIEAVRAFMMPMWAQVESAEDGIYDVKVEFRVNPGLEVGGNRIAEWAMRLADERLFRDGPKAEASWRVNDPVRVDLRWAKTSLDVPLSTQGPNVFVNERTVTFEERGPWALLRMIAFHQSSARDGSQKTEGGSHVLGFVVQSSPDSTGGFIERVGTDANTVRVFVRLALTGVEKDRMLKYPEFPATAPNL